MHAPSHWKRLSAFVPRPWHPLNLRFAVEGWSWSLASSRTTSFFFVQTFFLSHLSFPFFVLLVVNKHPRHLITFHRKFRYVMYTRLSSSFFVFSCVFAIKTMDRRHTSATSRTKQAFEYKSLTQKRIIKSFHREIVPLHAHTYHLHTHPTCILLVSFSAL